MKPKNIRIVIRKKLNHWIASIKDRELQKLVEENVIVTGGSIASMLLGEEVKDFDIYFRTKEVATKVAQYYVDEFKKEHNTLEISVDVLADRVRIKVHSAGAAGEKEPDTPYEYFEQTDPEQQLAADYIEAAIGESAEDEGKQQKYRPVFLTANAVTLSDKIQLITRFFGEPKEIHENYDFVHCTSFYSSWNGQLELPHEALTSLLSKELRYVGSKYPICSVIRMRKFIERGWYITAGQILKACWQISELNLNDTAVLEEQMTGVDLAYFEQVIRALRERDEKTVDSAYLFELLDKIF